MGTKMLHQCSAGNPELPANGTPASAPEVPGGDRCQGTASPSGTNSDTQGLSKGGAPSGNRNRLTHGVWSFLALGRLPKGASYVRRLMAALRRKLEADIAKAHGQVTLTHAALVTTVCRHEGRALLLSRYLAN